jgi:hypothetical protein
MAVGLQDRSINTIAGSISRGGLPTSDGVRAVGLHKNVYGRSMPCLRLRDATT